MAITLSTERWKTSRKGPDKDKEPRGSHYWRFRGSGKTTGRRAYKALTLTVETDGPFPQARDYALEAFRKAFGNNADIVVELMP